MKTTKNIILNQSEINQKINRIAYQILEANIAEKEIVVAGIKDNGFVLAKKISEALKKFSSHKITICEVSIDKKKPLNPIKTSLSADEYKNKSLVLVDDVLNYGTTLIYGVKHFLDVPLSNFKTAVLVNRGHKKYPIKADFKGISLSTSIHEHVKVCLEENEASVYLI